MAVTPGGGVPSTVDPHVLRLFLDERLSGEDVLDLGRPDAVGERAKSAMGRGVAVAADDGHAGKGEALLRTDDVDDALAMVELVVVFDIEIDGILRERRHLDRRFGVVDAVAAVGGLDVVIDHGERLLRRANLSPGHAQALEGLGTGDLVNEMPVDIEKRGAVRIGMDDVVVPDLVVKGLVHLDFPNSRALFHRQTQRRRTSVCRSIPAFSNGPKRIDRNVPGEKPPWQSSTVVERDGSRTPGGAGKIQVS